MNIWSKSGNPTNFNIAPSTSSVHIDILCDVAVFLSKPNLKKLAAATTSNILKCVKVQRWTFKYALKTGNRRLADYMISKGAKWWNEGMAGAAQGGHRHLVDYMISKGANYWNTALKRAARGGHRNLVDYMIEKGADEYNKAMGKAAKGGHYDLVNYMIEKVRVIGAKD